MSEAAPESRPTRHDSVLARHGLTRLVGVFALPPGLTVERQSRVILRTERGLESGVVLCPATPDAVRAATDPTRGQVVRPVNAQDEKRLSDLVGIHDREFARTEELIAAHKLPMQLVDLEHLFGGERAVFYFLAESRVDFRDLVKSMAREFQTRIELRQIGVRDEAKILADYGDCGRPVCCNTFLAVMPPVSMRMAKLQKSTLDPNKLSGRCGRLKCCLRYEQDVYEEFEREMPPLGTRVVTLGGPGRVLAHETLAKRVLVEFEDGRRLPVKLDEILSQVAPPRPGPPH